MALPTVLPFQPQFNYPCNKLYQYETGPVLLNCRFQVAATDPTGITGMIGNGFANVFMHTSTTPGAGNYGITNPNPAAGVISIQLQNNFQALLNHMATVSSPNTGSQLTATVANVTYVITALGTATTAQWNTRGLPVGFTPTIGQAFVASSTGTIGGSATVQAVGASGIDAVEVAGQANTELQNSSMYTNGGGRIIMRCLNAGTLTAPADGTIIRLSLYLSNSSVTVNGQ